MVQNGNGEDTVHAGSVRRYRWHTDRNGCVHVCNGNEEILVACRMGMEYCNGRVRTGKETLSIEFLIPQSRTALTG